MIGLIIEAKGLSKFYGEVPALDGLNLFIGSGGPVGLVGPNGAGKTTLFSLLGGFLKPSGGHLRILGRIPGDAALLGRFAILPQDARLKKGAPVGRQLAYFARLQGMSAAQAQTEGERVMALLGIAHLMSNSPEQLSHGQFKRTAIAQTLLGDPELVLLDEPTAGLDPVAAREVRRIILQQSTERTFMVSSHNLEEIRELCNEVVLLDKGKLVRHCRIDELIETRQYLTVTLSRSPTDAIRNLLLGLAGVRGIEISQRGDNGLLIRFDAVDADQFLIRVIERLSSAGISVTDFSRGRNLVDRVVALVNQSN